MDPEYRTEWTQILWLTIGCRIALIEILMLFAVYHHK